MPRISRDGASIAYSRAGKGTAILMLQGAGLVGNGWRPQIDALSDRYTIITTDNRGIGGSARGSGSLTIEAMADDALEILKAERIDRFHLAGHSMGGLIAQQIALTAPQRVLSLALLCTFTRGSQGSRLTPAMLLTALRMRIGSRQQRRRAFMELIMPPHYLQRVDGEELADRLRPLFGYDLASQPAIVMQQVRAMSRFDVSARLPALANIPALVLSATHDRIALPAFGQALAAAIPGSRYVEWPEAGHGVTIQCAAEINDLLADHFTQADQRQRAAATE